MAFRNIRFKKYDNQPLELQNLSYRYYEKSVDEDEEFTPDKIVTPANMVAQGTTHELGLDEVRSNSEFAIVYEGAFQVDHPGTYLFELRSWGGNRLTIDNRLLIDSEKQEASRGTIDLAAGTHTIQVLYYRGSDNGQPALSLRAEGPGIAMHELHAPSPVPADVMNPNTPKLFDPADEPVVMHGFIQGIKRMHPHSAAIGFPSDVHLAVDLNNVAVLKLWKGAFLDMSTMWVGRGGNDLKLNETAAFSLSGAPSLAVLPEENAPWPDSLQADTDYTFHNYQIDENGKVTLEYQFNQTRVTDRFLPLDGGKGINRELQFTTNVSEENRYYRVVAGHSISELPNGIYQVNDKSFYLDLEEDAQNRAIIRDNGKKQELIVPIGQPGSSSLSYHYIW